MKKRQLRMGLLAVAFSLFVSACSLKQSPVYSEFLPAFISSVEASYERAMVYACQVKSDLLHTGINLRLHPNITLRIQLHPEGEAPTAKKGKKAQLTTPQVPEKRIPSPDFQSTPETKKPSGCPYKVKQCNSASKKSEAKPAPASPTKGHKCPCSKQKEENKNCRSAA